MSNITLRKPFDDLLSAWPPALFGRDFLSRLRPDGALETEWHPRCDVVEADGALVVHAELPGVDRKDIEVTVSGTELVVRGEKRQEKKEEAKGRSYTERFFGSFERSISLPEGVDASKIEAGLKDGVLEVRVPLPEAKVVDQGRKIEIKAS
jgi:HSP20 family protein